MRDIKFRGWNKTDKKMYFWDKEPYLSFFIGDYGDILKNAFIEANADEFMQYTGLKDKNGKEIFEGDIICLSHFCETDKDHIHKKEIIKFKNGMYTAFYDDDLFINPEQNGIVIGNVWENPELLEGGK